MSNIEMDQAAWMDAGNAEYEDIGGPLQSMEVER